MLKRMLAFIALTGLFAFMPLLAPKDFPELIIGKWRFESFKFPNYVPANGPEANKWKRMFTGVVYTFTKTKLTSEKKDGGKLMNFTVAYTFSKDFRYLMVNGKQAFEIDYLDKERLNMYADGGPVGYFVRVKEVKK